MRTIRLFIEGGGPHERTQKHLRRGFTEFLRSVFGPRVARIRVEPRGAKALGDFRRALRTDPGDLNLLLVDSEGPVTASSGAHVAARVKAKCPGRSDQYHLMVQAFEAWLIADPETLSIFYGQGFRRGVLPRRHDVEAIPKDELEPKLRAASRATQKGEYHKIRHAAPLLERLDAAKVRERAAHCNRLFCALEAKLAELP